ncbi:WecB/TagA/CpsF family glycosyltransferase [Mucilaginibacter jinjuensis]|uniref:WecB/TagA/CpsF family glycosyltransferase n=1 Tax=Mucilaginibacter jinjuensis TaxID=1176721 RepID=A0ABY7T383_9SPHI|nr:WecB/TagA/CpsF family glycosyltransferase [Mucilaginibacter jinjuensis]WCT10729.1 WecB/TagA/CpsF family glycosyltransferase [Mucilaginibacter jinjuensis]
MSSNNQFDNISGYHLYSEPLSVLPVKPQLLINTINQYSYCIANQDPEFKKSLQESDVLLPDGIGVVMAIRFLTGKKVEKIAGADLHQYLLHSLNESNGKCFYLGASNFTLEKIKARVNVEYPNIKVQTYSPPFKKVFSVEDNKKIFAVINAFRPDVLFVGMTAPKQEVWATKNKLKLNAKLICSIGAVFDFYAGTTKRPNKIWINLGMEWLGRLTSEPVRLWKRYLYFGPVFAGLILKEKLKLLLIRSAVEPIYMIKALRSVA